MSHLLLFHCSNGCKTAPQCYVRRTVCLSVCLSVLLGCRPLTYRTDRASFAHCTHFQICNILVQKTCELFDERCCCLTEVSYTSNISHKTSNCAFILVINQLAAQNLFYNKFTSCLHMFRAPCAHRQEVKNCIIQPVVSSHL